MDIRNLVVKYLVDEYFSGSVEKAAAATNYSCSQLEGWITGKICPQKQTVNYLIHTAFVPEFKVIVEFGEFDPMKKVRTQLKKMLAGHEGRPGIYAFYDSMANLLYLGKATKLLDECYSAIRREVHVQFPSKQRGRTSVTD